MKIICKKGLTEFLIFVFMLSFFTVRAGAGQITALEDDFSGDLSSWTVMSRGGNADYGIVQSSSSSYLQLRTNETGAVRWINLQSAEYTGTDFIYELKMRLHPSALWTEIYFRISSPNDYYMLRWDRHKSTLSLCKIMSGKSVFPDYTIHGSKIGIKNLTWNSFKIDVKGNAIKVFVNDIGEAAFDVTDKEMPILSGAVGMGTYTGQTYQGATAEFDDVKVYEEGGSESYSYGGAALPPDLADLSVSREGQLLLNLGVINADKKFFQADHPISRGEFADILLRSMNITPEAVGKHTYIAEDTDYEYEFAAAAACAVSRGYMSVSDGKFRPEDIINYEEMLKALITAGGYTYLAERHGGYPQGYISAAGTLGYSKGVSSACGYAVTKDVLVKTLANAMLSKIPEISALSGSKEEYDISGDHTWLNKYFDVDTDKGIVEATPYAASGSAETCAKGYVIIDGRRLAIGANEPYKLLGREVSYVYCDNGSDVPYLVSAEETKYNEVTRIEAENILGFSDNVYTYTDKSSGRATSLAVDATDTVLYNGKYAGAEDSFSYTPAYGYVEYAKEPGGRGTLNIVSYKSIVVESFDKKEMRIFDKFRRAPIDLSDADVFAEDENGSSLAVSRIGAGSILLAAVSLDGTVALLVSSKHRAEGVLTGKSDDDITVDESLYELSPEFAGKEQLVTGQRVTVYIDALGRAAAAEAGGGKLLYACLIDKETSKSGIQTRLMIKLYMVTQSRVEIYACADNVTVDGKKYEGMTAVEKSLGDKNLKRELALIRLNERGEIFSVDFPYTDVPEQGESSYSLKQISPPDASSLYFNRQLRSFSNKFYFDAEAPIVFVPQDRTDEKNYRTVNSASGMISNDSYHPAKAYAIGGDTFKAEIVVLESTSSGVSAYPNYALLNGLNETLNENGEETWRLSVAPYGNLAAELEVDADYLTAEMEQKLKALKKGEVISVSLTADNKVGEINSCVYSPFSGEVNEISPEAYNTGTRCVVGHAYDTEDDILIAMRDTINSVSQENPPEKFEILRSASAKIYIFDKEKGSCVSGSVGDAYTYLQYGAAASDVVSVMEYMRPLLIVIYK